MTRPLEGLWTNNIATAQLLGLCPLLAVSHSLVNALGLGLATAWVLISTNVSISLTRRLQHASIRLPFTMLIIAGWVTAIDLLFQAYAHTLAQALGIFVPLIVTNCAILVRAESYARHHRPWQAAVDGWWYGLGFAGALVIVGATRELLGWGTLGANLDQLLGPIATHWVWQPSTSYPGFLLAILPPGAFIIVGLLIAAQRAVSQPPTAELVADETLAIQRARVTGPVR